MARGLQRRSEPARRMLLKMIQAEPGIPISRLAERYPFGWGSLYHNLAALDGLGLVTSRKVGRLHLYYPIEEGVMIPRRSSRPSSELSETARRVATFVARHPGANVRVIKAKLGLPQRTAYYHVENLVKAGYVKSSSEEKFTDLKATRKLLKKLDLEP